MIMPTRPLRVLLVDDNETFLEILTRFLLENHGGEFVVVGTAGGNAAALAQAKALQPQVILLDFDLPAGQGLALIRDLRSVLPQVSIVAMTLQAPVVYDYCRRVALTDGADDLILKNVLITELLPCVQRAVQARQPPNDVPVT
ncbi:MAG: response regulator [Chloroflexi bacterium]|nr:response regulator [Chloroflexota bacterium]